MGNIECWLDDVTEENACKCEPDGLMCMQQKAALNAPPPGDTSGEGTTTPEDTRSAVILVNYKDQENIGGSGGIPLYWKGQTQCEDKDGTEFGTYTYDSNTGKYFKPVKTSQNATSRNFAGHFLVPGNEEEPPMCQVALWQEEGKFAGTQLCCTGEQKWDDAPLRKAGEANVDDPQYEVDEGATTTQQVFKFAAGKNRDNVCGNTRNKCKALVDWKQNEGDMPKVVLKYGPDYADYTVNTEEPGKAPTKETSGYETADVYDPENPDADVNADSRGKQVLYNKARKNDMYVHKMLKRR